MINSIPVDWVVLSILLQCGTEFWYNLISGRETLNPRITLMEVAIYTTGWGLGLGFGLGLG